MTSSRVACTQRRSSGSWALYQAPRGNAPWGQSRWPWTRSWMALILSAVRRTSSGLPKVRSSMDSTVLRSRSQRRRGSATKTLWSMTPASTRGWASCIRMAAGQPRTTTISRLMRQEIDSGPAPIDDTLSTMSSIGASVEFRHVSKRFSADSPLAVNDLSLLIPPGNICVLVGPSGCGKTTSLRMVNRLIEPSSGQILIDERDVMSVEPVALRRRIGYVIQQIGLFPHQTIADNIATVPRLLGWPEERIGGRVNELLALIGLDPARVRNRYPAELSGGERQRVGVARALAAEPPVMLMDEPFGAVDPIARERLQDEFLRLHREQRTTVIFVTHDIDEAIKMGDRVAMLQQGGILAQYATPAELLTRPSSEFVARFVGADRGLKRLALSSLADVALDPAPAEPDGSLPRLGRETSLRDALSVLLGTDAQAGVVVDASGGALGVVTVGAIAGVLREAMGERE